MKATDDEFETVSEEEDISRTDAADEDANKISESAAADYVETGEENPGSEYTEGEEEIPAEYTDAQSLIGEDSPPAEDEIAASVIGSYGDHMIEEFSVESHVNKVVKYAKLPVNVAKYLLAVIYIAVGVLCAAIPHIIESYLPYIVGGGMIVVGLVQFVYAIIKKEYRRTESNKTASSLILIGLGIMLILEHGLAHTFIPIVWGVLGLFEGAHAFNHAFSRISRGMRSSYYIIKGIIEVVVAFMLLYKPEEYGELHIIVFGVSLIIDGITTAPIIHKLLARQ